MFHTRLSWVQLAYEVGMTMTREKRALHGNKRCSITVAEQQKQSEKELKQVHLTKRRMAKSGISTKEREVQAEE